MTTADVGANRRADEPHAPEDLARVCPRTSGWLTSSGSTRTGCATKTSSAAVDIVITKPGYGIISECIANDTALLYTSRGHFVEYDVLVREMPRWLRCGFISNEDLLAGNWQDALDRVLALPAAPEKADVDGAARAARSLHRQ